jgi:TldD protein
VWLFLVVNVDELLERALDAARLAGAAFAEARTVRTRRQQIEVKNGVPTVVNSESEGIGVRAFVGLAGGALAYGFAASARLDRGSAERTAREAARIAGASSLAPGGGTRLDDSPPGRGEYRTPVERDPFDVDLAEKIGRLQAAEALLRKDLRVRVAQGFFTCRSDEKRLATTDGADVEQTITQTGGGIAATAVEGSEVQVRSHPNSFRGNFRTAGFEFFESLDLEGHAPRVAAEAAALLSAPACPEGRRDVVLDGGQLALQVHESCGHPTELDRVLGTEASYAGTSFLTTDRLNAFRYGSEQVTIVADATVPGGLGTFGWDDEGVSAQRVPLVERGLFVGYISGRESAAALGRRSSGAARADGWNRIPLVRMTNINLEPGEWSVDDLFADTEGGLLLATNRSWSIDDRRLNFQFATEAAWEIEGGRPGRLYRNPTYTGITPEFWASCDAVCSGEHWSLWGTPNCGKGEPGQTMYVGHGTAPARFRNVRVGVMKAG